MLSDFQKLGVMELTPQLIARTLLKRELSKDGLAKALGIANSGVTELLAGRRLLKAGEVPKAKAYLGLDRVPVIGHVAAGAETIFFPDEGQWDRVPAPDDATENTVAVEIRGSSLGPLFDRWLVFYDRVERPITKSLIGHLCVVGLPEGNVLIKLVKESRTKGLFHLYSNADEPLLDREIEWAARVKSIAPRSRK